MARSPLGLTSNSFSTVQQSPYQPQGPGHGPGDGPHGRARCGTHTHRCGRGRPCDRALLAVARRAAGAGGLISWSSCFAAVTTDTAAREGRGRAGRHGDAIARLGKSDRVMGDAVVGWVRPQSRKNGTERYGSRSTADRSCNWTECSVSKHKYFCLFLSISISPRTVSSVPNHALVGWERSTPIQFILCILPLPTQHNSIIRIQGNPSNRRVLTLQMASASTHTWL